MTPALLLAAALLSSPMQTPPLRGAVESASQPAARAAQQSGMTAMRRYSDVSDAGNAILADALAAPDPQLASIVRQ